jgi:hypothetical protein
MSSTPSDLQKLDRKLNVVLYLVGFLLVFLITGSFIIPLLLPGRAGRANPIGAAWEFGRPFGADLDGSQEQRAIVERAKTANGADAARIDLHALNLSGLTLTEAEFETIGAMKELRDLNLRKTNIQDKDLAQLTGLWHLESLDVAETAISDASLPILHKLRNLRSLELAGSKVSGAGVRALHAKMPELHARLYGYHSMHSGNCVQATLGKIILVRYGSERIAFKFTEDTKTGDGGAKYVWYWQPEAGGSFRADTLKSGEAEVFEKYRRFKDEEGRSFVENDGGQLYMHMGPAKLEWSKPHTVYYPRSDEDAPPVRFALTPWDRVAEINFEDDSLQWYEKTSGNW